MAIVLLTFWLYLPPLQGQPEPAIERVFSFLKGAIMAAVPTGTLFSVATTFGSAITVTAVTNANPAVCTATAHGLSNGDLIEVTSGWGA